jgi:required for meiotic nuclear division protein 1
MFLFLQHRPFPLHHIASPFGLTGCCWAAQPLPLLSSHPLNGSKGIIPSNTMRILQREIAAGLRRRLHSSARPVATARPVPCALDPTPPPLRPRQRSLFTSSPLLAKDVADEKNAHATPAPDFSQPTPARPSSRKKPAKPAPGGGPKKSLSNPLRRVVSIAQRPGRKQTRPGVDGAGAEADHPEEDPSTKIRAICVAESFDMDLVVRILTEHCYQLDPDELGFDTADVVHARTLGTGGHGDVFVFPSGTVVTWGLPAEVGINMAQGTLLRAAHNYDLESAERESLDFEADDSMTTSTMRRDKVILGTKEPADDGAADGAIYYPTLAKIAFASGLARSTKIAFLEALLSAYFKKTKDIPTQLLEGRLAVRKKFILQRTGELLELRSQLNLYSELTDSLPDMFWDQDSELRLEQNYDQVGKALDVLDRIELLNQRMDYAQEMATVMREMYDTDHGAFLEKIIIALICIEVLFEIRRIVFEYKESMEKEHLLALERSRT